MSKLIPILGCGLVLLLGTLRTYAQPGTPAADGKLVPNVTGKNSSIGNIYSPSLFDGSANVNIPIYDFSNSQGNYGISLSYNTKGVKTDELSGKAGLHWDVNAGGGITRIMKDLPDEINTPHNSPVSTGGLPMHAKGRLALYGMSSVPSDVQADGENDDFIVSVGGLNFTFNLGKDGFVFTHPNRRAKVTYTGTGIDMTFKITDESGNQYFFIPGDIQIGTVIDNEDPSISVNTLLSYEYISRWVIEKIIFAEGSQIRYTYDSYQAPGTVLYRNFELKESVTSSSVTPYPAKIVHMSSTASYIAQLRTIRYPNGITASLVLEDYNAGTQACVQPIKEIVIGSGTDQCIRYKLKKVYQHTSGTEYPFEPQCDFNSSPNSRMVLKGIDMLSCDGTLTEPYYTFEYSTQLLPERGSNKQDMFGYYNGSASPAGTTIPKHTFLTFEPGVDRSVTTNVNILSAGNLVKVNNAYGGSVAFTYELHSGLVNVKTDYPGDPLFLGKEDNDGLRVKTITETDKFHPGNARIKTYTYSGGQRFLTGGFCHYLSLVVDNSLTPMEYKMGAFFITPHQFISGSNHGYSGVSVTTKDQSNNLLGRSDYTFTNFKNGTELAYQNTGTADYFQPPYTDKQYIKDWMVGLPLQTAEYDQNNLMVLRTTRSYTSSIDLSGAGLLQQQVKTMRVRKDGNPNPFTDPVVATDSYLPYTGWSDLTSVVTEKFMNGGQVITDAVTYGYDERHNLKWTKTRNSRGVYTHTGQVYNYDVVDGPGSGTLYNMADNKLEVVVSMERWKMVGGSLSTLLDASITGLQYNGGRLRTQSLYTLQSGSPIPYATYGSASPVPATARYNKVHTAYTGTQPASFLKVSEVQLFDDKGNPLETRMAGLNNYKAMLWDTATGNKLADVSNAKYNEIGFSSFEPHVSGLPYPTGTILTDGRFTYPAGGVTTAGGAISGSSAFAFSAFTPSSIAISGLTTGKEYIVSFWSKGGQIYFGNSSAFNVQALHTAQGWTYCEGRFTYTGGTLSFTANGSAYIDEVRLFPADAMMQCWTYKPLCGATSSTDAAGRITYLEYDKFGRPVLSRNQEGQILSKSQYTVNQ